VVTRRVGKLVERHSQKQLGTIRADLAAFFVNQIDDDQWVQSHPSLVN
jgi:hypothetical protein